MEEKLKRKEPITGTAFDCKLSLILYVELNFYFFFNIDNHHLVLWVGELNCVFEKICKYL